MNKVITMTDRNYFKHGTDFLNTRDKIHADFVCYGADLTEEQIKSLKDHDIKYEPVDNVLYQNKMQYLKFEFLCEQLTGKSPTQGVTFCDFDTFFIKDWGNVFESDFDLGITVRFGSDLIKNRCLRAYANGGVFFVHDSIRSMKICEYAMDIMNGIKLLPEYDRVWKTLEEGRKPEKTHNRTDLRWWVDQCFLSALVLNYFENSGYDAIYKDYRFNEYYLKFFDCKAYNQLDAMPGLDKGYIGHLKNTGSIERVS